MTFSCQQCGATRLTGRVHSAKMYRRAKFCGQACYLKARRGSWVEHRDGGPVLVFKNGIVSLISPEDVAWITKRGWSVRSWRNVAYVAANGTRERLHVLIAGRRPGLVVDHQNRDSLDNRRENLRHVAQMVNSRNHGMHRHNTSGVNGVSYRGRYKRDGSERWESYINAGGQRFTLGYHASVEEAATARAFGEDVHWGDQR